MLKAYAMALVMTTAAPVADKAADGAKKQVQTQAPATQIWKPSSVRI